jgi:CheY-like chemotaxis protein/anti-sigma regulatory factor (Ser/Thr protein kinase)
MVAGDEADLREVLMNLIYNAADAMPRGGELTFVSENHGDAVLLHVADTGCGMDDETQRRAFDPFFTTKGAGGSGLGLSSVVGIVRRLGGQVHLESVPGEGSRFTLELKQWLGKAPGRPSPSREILLSLRSFDCLLVDDNKMALDNLRQAMELLGQHVTTLDSGAAACQMLSERRFDLVITDLGMPEVNGWEVARCAQRNGAAVRLVLCTGWGDELEQSELEAHGVWRLLPKPYQVDQVQDLLRDLEKDLRRAAA